MEMIRRWKPEDRSWPLPDKTPEQSLADFCGGRGPDDEMELTGIPGFPQLTAGRKTTFRSMWTQFWRATWEPAPPFVVQVEEWMGYVAADWKDRKIVWAYVCLDGDPPAEGTPEATALAFWCSRLRGELDQAFPSDVEVRVEPRPRSRWAREGRSPTSPP